MEEKYNISNDCSKIISNVLYKLDIRYNDNYSDPLLREVMESYNRDYEYLESIESIKKYQTEMFSGINIKHNIELLITTLYNMQDEEYAYNLFMYYLENFNEQFMNILAFDFSQESMTYRCEDIIDVEFSHLNDEEKKDFCAHFNTVEDFIRLHPTLYNILYDAMLNYNKIYLQDYFPTELINIITKNQFKYDKSLIPTDEWFLYW